MGRRYLIPIIAVIGALLALGVVFWSQRKTPTPPLLFPPATSPFPHPIAGTGIVEASSQNIFVGSPFNQTVSRVYVEVGDRVKKADPLFELDTTTLEAQKIALQATVELARTKYEDKKIQFSFYERLQDKRAVSEQSYSQVSYALYEAENEVEVAKGNLQEIEANITKSTVKAPVDGEILQVNIRVGEMAPTNPFVSGNVASPVQSQGTLILIGSVQPLQMRIDINEEDCWRFHPGAKATAFVRGNSKINFPMEFAYIEPYIIPKSSFTGANTERVDTRVLQVVYRFKREDLPIYVGQILDVFIEGPSLDSFQVKE